ncbi:hypothetical protein [Niallia sp. NCCP-28]|uniref:hypothetical protein n=1 Tax=Niallia sp. NCCP-28 TaxID=2934712 RepID=UPI00207DB6A3|nr:hypothetical protein [Niallia sp. NCCP-28]GKU84779.1 hypothetical protein NCCP28_41750 [Niallia sp. NCCP-28]
MLARTKEYENLIAVHAQKLFHLVFCIVREEELASRVVEKVFVTAYNHFFEMEQKGFEKYLFQLAAKMAVTCNKTTRKKQINEQREKQRGFDSLLKENQQYTKLASKQRIHFV